MFNNILVVCVGNICRSPTGEYLLKRLLPNKHIASAGIATSKSKLTGQPADKVAKQVALANELSLEQHSAQQLTSSMCQEFDLILVMEKGHIDAVCAIAPEARGKTMLFSHWLDKVDIPDPYRQSEEAYRHAWNLIEKSAHKWVAKL